MRALANDVTPSAVAAQSADLATAMLLRGAFGTLIGAAASPRGREGVWGAAGFIMGTMFDYYGIAGVAFVALYDKMSGGSGAGGDGGLSSAFTPNRARRRRGRRRGGR